MPVGRPDVPRKKIEAFCRRWNIRELSLFGSFARGDAAPDSDVDLLVTFAADADWSLLDFARMREELRGIFGRDVDLIEESALRNPFRRRAILRDKTVIHAA